MANKPSTSCLAAALLTAGTLLPLAALTQAPAATATATAANAQHEPAVDVLGNWTAEYRVLYGKSTIGEAVFRLEDGRQTGTKLLESRTEARGLARMLRSRPVVESSTFTTAGGLFPLAYRFEDGTRKGKKNMHIDFDRQQARAVSLYQGDTYELPLGDATLDRLVVIVAMMRDAAAGNMSDGYQVADKREVKTYYLEGPKPATVQTPAGTFDALHFTRLREGSSRVMEMWLAPELGYLPVRMRHTKEGDETARLELTATSKLQ